ncbi:Putative disease resistance protein [Morus notabilis]|uniref:Putative disease resistance protein n=1 Tax=Morus notabilis TaxID=981085 RepID=W9QBI1_9ROSA|nr:Putative disease resistance protein [Morus notabilis]
MLVYKVATAVASWSSSSTKYDVFLNFRGDDTRDNFISHLYKELDQKGIKTFMDDKLKRGDKISSALLKTIEKSKISLIIFSKNYASSSWCLDELVHILQCKERSGDQVHVVPIFYGVEPSSVRTQSGSYEVGLAELEKRCKDKILVWRDAMKKAVEFSGWDSQNVR